MKFTVKSIKNEVSIEITDTAGNQKQLLEAFRECQEGRCSCHTQEYSKLESLEIENHADSISLKLKPKAGEQFDENEISKCLACTKEKTIDKQ